MRRLLTFLLLLALGLAVLMWIDRATREVQPLPEPVIPGPSPEAGVGEPVVVPGDEGQEFEVTVGGFVDFTHTDPESGVRLYRLRVRDARSIGEGALDGEGVELELFDELGERVVRTVSAEHGNLRLSTEGGRLAIDKEFPVTLQRVTARIEEGVQFAPVELRVPVVQVLVDDRSMRSLEEVVLTGRGLAASGRGLFVDGASDLLRLDHDPLVELELEGGQRAMLVASGPLTVLDREDLGAGRVEVRAGGGARLAFEGEDRLEVDAEVVRLFGQVEHEPDRFVPLRAEGEGDVVLQPADGTFRGDTVHVEFGDDALPRTATLFGSPRVDLSLREGGIEPDETAEPKTLPVVATGEGELLLSFGTRASFELEGPATLTLPTQDATLVSQGPLSGARELGSRYATLSATGGVVVSGPGSSLTAEAIDVEALPAEDESVYSRMTTHGDTRAVGTLPEDGRDFELTASRGLVYVRRGDTFEVPLARGVTVVVGAPDPFTARADEVRDLVAEAFSFTAEGGVELDNELGVGSGARLIVHGREHVELFGEPDRPARFVHADGELAAGRIEYRPTRLFAQGAVRADVTLEGLVAHLESRWASVEKGRAPEAGDQGADWVFNAGGAALAQVDVDGERQVLRAERMRIEADEVLEDPMAPEGARQLVPRSLQAEGAVDAVYQAAFRVHGNGERLEVEPDGTTRLWPAPGERLALDGELPDGESSFELTASFVEYGAERLEALDGSLYVSGVDVPLFAGEDAEGIEPLMHAVSGRLLLDSTSLLFSEGSHISRLIGEQTTWSLDGEKILLVGAGPTDGPSPVFSGPLKLPSPESALEGSLDELYAWGGFVAHGEEDLTISGERLHVSRARNRVIVTGEPAAVSVRGLVWRSDWFELNRTTRSIQSGAGEVNSTEAGQSWTLNYESLHPVERLDTTIQVLREPRVVIDDGELRASWALFWVDPRRWRALSGEDAGASEAPVEERRAPLGRSLFGELERLQDVEWLREVYLEGNIEYSVQGDVLTRAESVYVDLVDGHGWVRDVVLQTQAPGSSLEKPLKLRADWLRHSADGSYHADSAVATTCTFEEPHYVVKIGRLTIEPRVAQRMIVDPATGEQRIIEEFGGWHVRARNNRLSVWRDLGLPLPRIGFPLGPDYEVDTESVSVFGMRPMSLGQDAKYGTFVGTSFSLDFSWLAGAFDSLFSGGGSLPGLDSGRADLDARWLDDRGVLLGLAMPFNSPGRYWLDVLVDGLFDTGEDKGLVRVPEDERSEFRGWFRARGRFLMGEREWLDVVMTHQSDPGVQAEFFERDYVRFEERETYLHWRKAKGDTHLAATVEARLDSFLTEVTETPSFSYFNGSSRIASIGSLPVQYGSKTTAGYYKRLEGKAPYEDPFADGLGERDVLRLDTDHRLEVPADLGFGGLRATPFVEGRLTAWDEGADPDEQPLRTGLIAGVELATSLFRSFAGGSRHVWTPSVGVHTDLVTSDDDVALVPIDGVEAPISGTFVDLGLRSRWMHTERRDSLDIGLEWTYGEDLAGGASNGWLPLSTRSTWLSTAFGFPYVISHDGLFDTENDQVDYSRALFGFRPVPPVDIEVSQVYGLDPATDTKLFDAVGVGARYRFTRKWELEGRQTFSNLGDGRLASEFLIRRIGHDFIFEIESRFVAGEGDSFGFKLSPLLLYEPRGFGLLDALSKEVN